MTEEEIYRNFPKVMHRLGKISLENLLGELTQSEFWALNIIHTYQEENKDTKGIYVSQLSLMMKTSTPGISRLLRTMEEEGLVERTVDREDRRNTFVTITELGERLRTEGGERLDRLFKTVLERIGIENLSALLEMMTRFVDTMQEETNKLNKEMPTRQKAQLKKDRKEHDGA